MRPMITLVLLIMLALAVGGVLPGDRALYPVRPGGQAVAVYIVDNGFHSDLALPRDLLLRGGGPLAATVAKLPPSPWVLVGWGDSSYYRGSIGAWSRKLDALRAILRPGNAAVVRLEPLAAAPDVAYPLANVTSLSLSPLGFRRLTDRLSRSFRLSEGAAVLVEARITDTPEFYYASTEHFGIAKTCTSWTSQLLNAAGVPAHRVLDATVAGLLLDLRLRAGVSPHESAPA